VVDSAGFVARGGRSRFVPAAKGCRNSWDILVFRLQLHKLLPLPGETHHEEVHARRGINKPQPRHTILASRDDGIFEMV